MPEISFLLFDLEHLFKLFPKENKELKQQIEKYELEIEQNMEQNRLNLFGL